MKVNQSGAPLALLVVTLKRQGRASMTMTSTVPIVILIMFQMPLVL